MSAKPWFHFYPDNWKGDDALRMCSLHARGLWLEMLCIMRSAEPVGHLTVAGHTPTEQQLATLTGCDVDGLRAGLSELETYGVFSRVNDDPAGVIYSRKMVREAARTSAVENGKKGGNPNLERGSVPKDERVRWNRQSNPTKVEAVWHASKGLCKHCGVSLTRDDPNAPTAFEIDHVKPLRDGGTNDIENLQAACKSCNFDRVHQPMSNRGANAQKTEDRRQKDIKESNDSFVVGPPSDDVRTAFEEWNALAKRLGLPIAKGLDPGRRAVIKARLKSGGLEVWREVLAAVEASPYCLGENASGWRADLEFVCTLKSWRRLREGAYGPRAAKVSAPRPALPRGNVPDDVREAFKIEMGEAWAASYIDQCQWEPGALIAANGVACEKIRARAGMLLTRLGLAVRSKR